MPLLSIHDAELHRDGAPHRILAGAVHYFRVHPDQWRDRLRRLAAMGANTVDTYVAWNAHQPREGEPADFTGGLDLGRFIDLAGELGLDVIVRPGPYICAEWDNGGIPAWLTSRPGLRPRSQDAEYMAAVVAWFDELLPHITSRQADAGGPVVAVQVENEYGSYGDDVDYMAWHRRILEERGVTELLFTADGGTDFFLDGGPLPDTWATATLGSRGAEAIEIWRRRRPQDPFLAAEFWGGWFDHWGQDQHKTRDPEDAAAEVAAILDGGGSVCLYMAHGGTNFGLRNGANHEEGRLKPTVTSYDSDAPIAEDGRLTEKFFALRREFHGVQGREEPALPEDLAAPPATLDARSLELAPGRPLLEVLRSAGESPISSPSPLSFGEVGLDAGLMLYSAEAVLPGRPEAPTQSQLGIIGLADRAQIWLDSEYAGVLDDVTGESGLTVTGTGRPVRVDILVENLGRINYGPRLGADKGILGGVTVRQRMTFGWTQTPVPLDRWDPSRVEGLAHAVLDVEEPADTHLALPGSGKGFVWINGFLLGRYWEQGPQQTLYVPAPLLRPGSNTIHVLELQTPGAHLELREAPELGTPSSGPIADAELT
ncbi:MULTISPECIES: beta-galactosidase family protein [Actinomycetes]|uniref:Beta-galactosidase n=2 Tax=Actinomycetes TaxID=1760 RepID=A0ABP6M3M4_9MICC